MFVDPLSSYGRRLLSALVVVLSLVVSVASPSIAEMSSADRQEVERIVRELLESNPEIVGKALLELQRRQEQAAELRQKQAITAYREDLFNDPAAPVLGNASGDVTIVEFFDYQCGYCKRVMPTLMETLKTDSGVRLVAKEYPILGPDSLLAAKAALAAHRQGNYAEFHSQVMGLKGSVTKQRLLAVAADIGLNTAQIERDMEDPAIVGALQKNYRLAEALGISSTPTFVIGDQVIPGAIDAATLNHLIDLARK